MPLVSMKEPLCESPFEPTPNGCCADGRQCDEICIASIASQECERAYHAPANNPDREDTHCLGETTKSGSQPEHHVSSKQLYHGERDSHWADTQSKCASKDRPHCWIDDSKAKHVDSKLPSQVMKRNDCESKSGAIRGCKPDRSLPEDSDEGKSPSNSKCCSKVSQSVDQQISPQSTQSVTCCDTKDSLSVTTTELSKDLADDTESYKACSFHIAEAMNKYEAYLKAGICICRDALKQLDVCCSKTSRDAATTKRRVLTTTASGCASTDASNKLHRLTDGIIANSQNDYSSHKHVEKSCCSTTESVGKTICGTSKPTTKAVKSCNAPRASCCPGPKGSCSTKNASDASGEPIIHKNVNPTKPLGDSAASGRFQDLEQSAAREHAKFSITGMTCTGCVKKVLGVLSNVNGVDNVQINFVAAIGDFDVDIAKITVPVALHRLEKETGFKCLRIISNHQTLDLNVNSTAAERFTADLPKGVVSVEKMGKEAYRVSYDPWLIGARAVLTASGGQIAPPSNDGAVSEGRRRMMLMSLSFLGATVFTVPVCILAFSSLAVAPLTRGIVELVLATFVQLIAVPEFYAPALKALLFSKTIEMDMLVVTSITAAYGYSIVAFGLETTGINLEQGALFETSTLLITLVLLGRLIASYAKVRAVQAVSLRSLQAETAMLEDFNGETTQIDARLLEFHDVIRIPAHSKIVSDGEVIGGESAVDESMLTGESLPVPKTIGDAITAGTLNGPGVLRVRLTRLPGKNSITDIADLVQNALNSKPRVQDLADVIAGYFVPVVVMIASIVFAIWIAVALRIRNQNAGGAIGTAVTFAIAVLAVSCPCALGLAVPMVLVISGGVAARSGVIIKQMSAMERGFKVTDVVFDKTGTLTTGQLEVVQQVISQSNLSTKQVLAITYALIKDDSHPVAQAVAADLKSQGIAMEAVEEVESVPGCGVQALWHGQQVKAGNPYWLDVDTSPSVRTLQARGYTLFCVTIGHQLLVSIGLKAMIRPEAQAVVNVLQKKGLTCHIISGDEPTSVSNVALSLGIPTDNIASRQSPASKQCYINNLKSAERITLFVGDGTNDAVAIAAADVGLQIGAASDVTRATADVVLLGGLEGVITLLEVSKQSFYRIVFNFVWSGVYNVFAILLASGAFVKARIAPNYAGLGEIVSVLPVVLAALTMLKVKTKVL